MELDFIRGLITAISLGVFVGLMAWVYWPGHRDQLEVGAREALGHLEDDSRTR